MRFKIEDRFEAILEEDQTRGHQQRTETNEMRNVQPSGSKNEKSKRLHRSDSGNTVSENEDYPLRASERRNLKHPAKAMFQNELRCNNNHKRNPKERGLS